MLAPKLPPVTLTGAVDVDGMHNFTMGSLSSILGHTAAGYESLQPWPAAQPDPTIRDALRYNTSDGNINYSQEPSARAASRRYSESSSDANEGLDQFYGDKPRRKAPSTSSASSRGSAASDSDSGSDESSSGGSSSSDGSDSESGGSTSSSSSSSSSGRESAKRRAKRNQAAAATAKAGSTRGGDLPVPYSARQTAAPPAPVSHSKPAGGPAPAASIVAAADASKTAAVVSKQGVRKVSASGKTRKDVFGTTNALIPTASGSGMLSGSEDEHGAVGGRAMHMGGEDLLQDPDALAQPPSQGPVASLGTGLLMPTVRTSPSPAATPEGGNSPMSRSNRISSLSSPTSSSTGHDPALFGGAVALPSAYTGLMAMGAAGAAGRPSAMLGGAQRAAQPSAYPSGPSGSAGLAGNQRMMMQTPPALAQHGEPTGAVSGHGTSAPGVLTAEPALAEGERRSRARVILRPEMGGGLAVSMVFRNGVPAAAYSGGTSALLLLKNVGDQQLRYGTAFLRLVVTSLIRFLLYAVDASKSPSRPSCGERLFPRSRSWCLGRRRGYRWNWC
jgi:hypothetical protein